jgi:hypothetical protein
MPISALPTPPSRADAVNFSDRADAFLLSLPGFVTETNALATLLNNASAAAIAAATSAVNAPGTNGTSTSGVVIGTGAKAWVTQAGKSWVSGQFVLAVDTANVDNWMHGQITAYAGTGLTLNVLASNGAGTPTSWNLMIAMPYVPATAAEIRAGTASNKIITPAGMIAALAEVTIADAATITLDMSTFINGVVTLGGNRTFANPTVPAGTIGTTRRLRILQDGTGNRVPSWGSNFDWDLGAVVALSTAAGAEDDFFLDIVSATKIVVSTKKSVA